MPGRGRPGRPSGPISTPRPTRPAPPDRVGRRRHGHLRPRVKPEREGKPGPRAPCRPQPRARLAGAWAEVSLPPRLAARGPHSAPSRSAAPISQRHPAASGLARGRRGEGEGVVMGERGAAEFTLPPPPPPPPGRPAILGQCSLSITAPCAVAASELAGGSKFKAPQGQFFLLHPDSCFVLFQNFLLASRMNSGIFPRRHYQSPSLSPTFMETR